MNLDCHALLTNGMDASSPDMYAISITFRGRWCDTQYGGTSNKDWHIELYITTNKSLPPDNCGLPKHTPIDYFWANRIYITDTHILFGSSTSSLYITTIDGLVCVRGNRFICPLHPSITFQTVCDTLKEHLVMDTEYRFPYDTNIYTPPITITF